MGLIIPLKSAKSVQVEKLSMTNPTKLLRSRRSGTGYWVMGTGYWARKYESDLLGI
ncbi:MAG: hypothetical protein V7K95_24175 [Nostoc sp.]